MIAPPVILPLPLPLTSDTQHTQPGLLGQGHKRLFNEPNLGTATEQQQQKQQQDWPGDDNDDSSSCFFREDLGWLFSLDRKLYKILDTGEMVHVSDDIREKK